LELKKKRKRYNWIYFLRF